MPLRHEKLVAWQRARRSDRERAHFLTIADASLAEVGYCLHVARRLGYIDNAIYSRFDLQVRQTAAPLVGLIRTV